MHSTTSPSFHYPSTPAALRNPLQFKPMTSSPLAEILSSPVVAAQARRKSQYKSHSPTTTPIGSRRLPGIHSDGGGKKASSFVPNISTHPFGTPPDNPPKLSMREKFRARCIERAVKERKRAIAGKRYVATEPSSDDYQMDDDESEDEEDIMKDELFRRIMENTNRKQKHSYRLSYAVEVGSSFDPNIEDIDYWEQELAGLNTADSISLSARPGASTRAASYSKPASAQEQREEMTPFDFDDEELEAYAKECARVTALADFEDLPEEELFSYSDIEELQDMDTS